MPQVTDELDLKRRIGLALLSVTKPIGYGALARDLQLQGPGTIEQVTAALEALMQDDAQAGRPFLAAMCEGRLSGGMPAQGFFQMAARLGRYGGPLTGPEATAFVLEQRRLLGRD